MRRTIYGFRAADVRNILDFPEAFAPPARLITLDRNYRSTDAILRGTNAVIGEARERFAKDLWTERRSDRRPLLVTVYDETAQARGPRARCGQSARDSLGRYRASKAG